MVDGTKRALEEAGGFEVVGEASNGAQVLPLVKRLKPDLVLLDLRMPQMDGLTCLTKLKEQHPDVKVAILSVSQDPDVIQTVLNRGANAYIVKTVNPVDLPAALRQAVEGTVFTAIGVTGDAGETAAKEAGLTERELVILRAVARGLSNEAIAKELWVA
ncbi:MAG: response regulator transcription factor, partial [Actinobacteria bacterium]